MVLIIFLVNSSNVFSAASGNGNDYPGGSLGSCSGTNCIWSGQVGIRFSLVDGDGTKVSGTHHIDAWVMNKIPDSIKRYELWDDKGNRLWDFDGAYYGQRIAVLPLGRREVTARSRHHVFIIPCIDESGGNPHAFRHTMASLLIASGIDPVTTATELGHADANITQAIYAHQIARARAEASGVRAGVFSILKEA